MLEESWFQNVIDDLPTLPWKKYNKGSAAWSIIHFRCIDMTLWRTKEKQTKCGRQGYVFGQSQFVEAYMERERESVLRK